MTLTLSQILDMAGRTVMNPREGASEVMSLGIPRDALWIVVGLVVVLSVFVAQIAVLVGTMRGAAPEEATLYINPIAGVVLQFGLLLGMGGAVHLVGRAMGGKGSFPEAVLLMAWLQFIMICVQVLQILAIVILPGLATVILLLAVALFLWLLTNFVAELHGFSSLGQVFVMILVTSFAIAFFLSLALTLLGVAVPIESGGI